MRLVFLAGAASLFVVMTTFACSSSTTSEATDTDAGSPPPRSEPAEEEPDPGSSSGDPAPSDAGSGDAADENEGGGSTDGDGGVHCKADSIRESEANDTEGSADALPWKTSSYCGRLSGADVDVMTFTIPSSQKGFEFTMTRTLNGGYKIDCSVDGQSFQFDGKYPYEINKPYFCKLSLTGAASADYRVDLKVTPN